MIEWRAQIEIYQWIVPLVAVYYLVRLYLQRRQGRKTTQNVVIWTAFWIFISLAAIVPNALSKRVATLLGFESNVNALIFVALGVLFILVFQLSATVNKLELKLTELVRELAIRDAKEKE